jgi:methylated-DNA-protein-cysteine methyltransferase-like protein
MAVCPEDTPWHRVINAQGKISLRGGGDSTQRRRLEDEGVIFDERSRVNLKIYQWNGKNILDLSTGGINE